jgi:glycosyltransferase involved in cell wall biosynthesis
MAVLEALAVGLPVVLSADCGLARAVEKSGCGIVVNDGLTAFTAAVRGILADPGLAREMGERGRMLVRREFSMSAVGDRLIDVYSQTIGN